MAQMQVNEQHEMHGAKRKIYIYISLSPIKIVEPKLNNGQTDEAHAQIPNEPRAGNSSIFKSH
jgi:hypothetical protein